MAIIVKDSFDRADSTTLGAAETGQLWQVYKTPHSWGIQGGLAYPIEIDANDPIFVNAAVADQVAMQVTVVIKNTLNQIMWRIANGDNYFILESDEVFEVVQDVWTSKGFAPNISGDVVRIELRGSEHRVFINGSEQLVFTSTTHQTATNFGFSANSLNTRYDDFLVETLVTEDPATLPVLSELTPANNNIITANSTTITARVTDAENQASVVNLELSRTQDFAVLSHNLTQNAASGGVASFSVTGLLQGNYYWRVRARNNITGAAYGSYTAYRGLFVNIPATGKLYPDALLLQTGYTGAVSAIVESPDTPDANWLTTVTTPTADTILRASFPTPPKALRTGAGLQKFRVRIRKNKTTTSAGTYKIGLYESNVLKGTEQTYTIANSGTQEQIVTFLWDASLLAAVSGANVEIRSVGNGYTGNSTNATRFGVNIGAIEWEYAFAGDTQVLAPTGDTTPPAEVPTLTEVHSFTTATLTWTKPADSDFSHVRILRNGTQIATNQTGTTYADSGLANGTQYTYLVKTVDLNGNESAGKTIVLTTNIPDTTPPAEVTNLIYTATVNSATLSWTNPTTPDFSHVRILRGGVGIANNITAGTYVDSGLSQSTQYTYAVRTVDTTGNESAGVPLVVDTPAPPIEVAPMLTTLLASRAKISDETGLNTSTLTIVFDTDVAAWTVNVTGSSPMTGIVADSGGAVAANTPIFATIDWTELYQEGQNRVNIYGRTAGGTWTPYGAGIVVDGGTFGTSTFGKSIDGGTFENISFTNSYDGDTDRIKFRKGLKADLPQLEISEIGFCTDTKEIYVGSADGNVLLNGSE